MKRILNNLIYLIEYDEINQIVYVRDNIKTKHIEEIRLWLISSGIIYKNIIVGRNYDGEY